MSAVGAVRNDVLGEPAVENDRQVKHIDVGVGESFDIRLWEDRTRGEQWVPAYEPASLALVSDEFTRTASGNAVDTGNRTFQFRAAAAGEHRLVFEKRMGWKFTAEDRRVFVVRVVGVTGSQHA